MVVSDAAAAAAELFGGRGGWGGHSGEASAMGGPVYMAKRLASGLSAGLRLGVP